MKRFKVSYTNGFSMFDAKDIYELVKVLKQEEKRFFKYPVKIEEVTNS